MDVNEQRPVDRALAGGAVRGSRPWFLGVDVAGADNTWAAALVPTRGGSEIVWGPRRTPLAEVLAIAEAENVAAVAIDAQLTTAISDERGFRSGDQLLRAMLPTRYRDWVASVNSLMAVPVRGQLLAEALGTVVGTILETHPRASLHFALGDGADPDVGCYKRGPDVAGPIARLWRAWAGRFGITGAVEPLTDGGLDALVCATVALLYHREPHRLVRLPHRAADRRGRGPFVVIAPSTPVAVATLAVEHAVAISFEDGGDLSDGANGAARSLPVVPNPLDGPAASESTGVSYADALGRSLVCPACAEHEFARWPFGWDAHVAHACRGIEGHDAEVRKAAFKSRFRMLFRP